MSTITEIRVKALEYALQYNAVRAQLKGYYKYPSEIIAIADLFEKYISTGEIPVVEKES